MKSVCCSGTYARLVCDPWNRPVPHEPARADGGHRLAHVVPRALQVLPDVEDGGDPVELIVLQELEVHDGEGTGDGQQRPGAAGSGWGSRR